MVYLCKECSALSREEKCPINGDHEMIISTAKTLLREVDIREFTFEGFDGMDIDTILENIHEYAVIRNDGWGLLPIMEIIRYEYEDAFIPVIKVQPVGYLHLIDFKKEA